VETKPKENKMAQEPLVNQTEGSMAWDDLRTSPAFPAIVGGLAGALGGVALMIVWNRFSKPKEKLPAAYDANGNPMNIVYLPPPSQFRILGFTIGDLITLATIGFSMARQVQDMMRENEAEPKALSAQNPAVLPPSPADLNKPVQKI
jgi:hypothetical protein